MLRLRHEMWPLISSLFNGPLILVVALTGCAAVGPPIAPEEIGIEAKIRQHQKENQSQEVDSEYPEASVEDENMGELPESYPIGIR